MKQKSLSQGGFTFSLALHLVERQIGERGHWGDLSRGVRGCDGRDEPLGSTEIRPNFFSTTSPSWKIYAFCVGR